jgi:kynurenine formamidase
MELFGDSTTNRPLEVIDLTLALSEQTPSYPGDPLFSRIWHAEFDQNGFCVSKLEMSAHSGTHVDAPFHFLGNQFEALMAIPLQSFMGEATALERLKAPGEDLSVADLDGAEIHSGDIVLFRTGWDRRAGSPAFFQDEWPGMQPSLVEELIRRDVKAIGGDIASVDSPAALAGGAPAHKMAGRAGMPIFEGLVNLDQVIGRRFLFFGLPLKLEGAEASPIRAVAIPLNPQANKR